MRVLVERDPFADAIGSILHSTQDRKDKEAILANVFLRASGDKLVMVGTDGTMQFETFIPAQILSGGEEAVTVKATVLDGIAAELPKGSEANLEWEDAAAGVTLKSGRCRYRLPTLPAADFPRLREPENPTVFSLPGETLAEHLKAVLFAVSKDETRFYLCGVATQLGKDDHPAFGRGKNLQLEFVATNGHQFARTAMPAPATADAMPAVIVPGRAVGEIVRLSTNHPELEVSLAIGSTSLAASVAANVLTTKLIDATFPQYELMVPHSNNNHVMVDVEELSLALRRLRHLGADNRTYIELSHGLMKISLANPKTGEAYEEIAIAYEGTNLFIGFNASEILSILDHLRAEVCRFEFGRTHDPVVIRAMRGGQPDYTCTYLCTLMRP